MERGNECRNILRSKGQVPFSRWWGRKMGFQLVGHFVLALYERTQKINLCPSLTLPSLSQEGVLPTSPGCSCLFSMKFLNLISQLERLRHTLVQSNTTVLGRDPSALTKGPLDKGQHEKWANYDVFPVEYSPCARETRSPVDFGCSARCSPIPACSSHQSFWRKGTC